jgi:hypothetical protein
MDIDELKNTRIHTAFLLGVMTAEHVHGVSRNMQLANEIYRVLEDVADGNLTLHNTPEETSANLPPEVIKMREKMPEEIKQLADQLVSVGLRLDMRNQREVAVDLVAVFKSVGFIK